jgi:hypothetical protein
MKLPKLGLFSILTLAAWPVLAFQPNHLVVLRAGDGQLELKLKQSPIFLDEFLPGQTNAAPVSTVAIPTNGPDSFFFNGHAATEGMLARSGDHQRLTFAGYGGVALLQSNGTPALLDIGRGFCTVDASGKTKTTVYKLDSNNQKLNPRGMASDDANRFWGCGSAIATLYYDTKTAQPMVFENIESTRDIRIINHTAYVTLNGADGIAADLPAGIFTFANTSGSPEPLPVDGKASLKSVVAAKEPYSKIAGFDMNPEGTIAYTADTSAGIQKYIKENGNWQFAYNFTIPQTLSDTDNRGKGCFGIAVDFSGKTPVIYATTMEGAGGCANANRLVQITDTNANAQVITLARAPAETVFKGVDFAPENADSKH